MTDEMTKKPTREIFVGWIDDRLTKLGFEKNPEVETWAFDKEFQTHPQTIIINGQRHDQPGEIQHLRFEVEIFGDGEIKDTKTEAVDSFIEVNFNVFQNEEKLSDWPMFCMFFDDEILFNSLLTKIFKL